MQQPKGFTFIELMVVLAIGGMLLMFGAPSFIDTVQDGRLRSQAFEVANLLAYTRSEAAKRPNTTVTVCPASNPGATNGCTNTASWENGWIVLSDVNGNRSFDNATDQVLKISPALSNNNRLRTVGFGGLNYIQFDDQGIPAQGGTFVVCDSRGASRAKAVIMSVAGQMRMAVDTDNDGILNDHNGTNITCPG